MLLLLAGVNGVLLQGFPILQAEVSAIKDQVHFQVIHPKNLMQQTLQLPKLYLPPRLKLLAGFVGFLVLAVQ